MWRPATPSPEDLEEFERQKTALSFEEKEANRLADPNVLTASDYDYAAPAADPSAPTPPPLVTDPISPEASANLRGDTGPVPALSPMRLDQPSKQVVNAQTAAYASPVKKALNKPQEIDAGPAPRSRLATLLSSLPNIGANLATAALQKNPRYGFESSERRRQENRQDWATDERARLQYANRKRFLERQQGQDALQAEDRQRRIGREDRADKLSAEATDPKSRKNEMFRRAVQKAYPEVWESLTPEQQTGFTIADAHALAPSIDMEKTERAASAKGKAEAAEEAKQKRLIDYRNQSKQKFKLKGGGGGVALDSSTGSSVMASISEAYEGKVPAEVATRVQLANAIRNPAKRAAKLDAILKDVTAATYKDATKKRLESAEERKTQEADFKEKKEYQNNMNALREARRTKANIDKALKGDGVNPKNYKGEGISGYGRVESFLHPALLTDKGQEMRSLVKDYASQLVRARSGKAATDTERKYLEEVLGAADGMGERQLIMALNRMDQINASTESDLQAVYPSAAAAVQANLPDTERELEKGGAKGTVKLYRGGEEFDIPAGEVEEALKDGFSRGR